MIRMSPYTPAHIYFKKISHFLTFQTSKLPKTVATKTKNMTSFPCCVRPEKFHLYTLQHPTCILAKGPPPFAGQTCPSSVKRRDYPPLRRFKMSLKNFI